MEWLVAVGVVVVLLLVYFWRPRGKTVEAEPQLYDSDWRSENLKADMALFRTGSGYGS